MAGLTQQGFLDRCDTVDLDIEMPGPSRDVHEDAGRRIFRKIARIDRVHGCEFVN
jgi:hypothetical protein